MKELFAIQQKLNAPKTQYNKFGNYYYRSCEDILKGVKPLLAETNCVLTITDEIKQLGERFYIEATATLMTSGGVKISVKGIARESLTKKGMDDSQITGTASSYARKYALNGLFAIDDSKDADTNAYHKQSNQPQRQQKPKPQAPQRSQVPQKPLCPACGQPAMIHLSGKTWQCELCQHQEQSK